MTELKTCKKHGETPHRVSLSQNRRRLICNKCNTEKVSARRKMLKKLLVEYKGSKCKNCGYDRCIDALAFHHRDANIKKFGLSHRGLTRSIEILKKEADKCDLLCANCHAEEHFKLRNSSVVK